MVVVLVDQYSLDLCCFHFQNMFGNIVGSTAGKSEQQLEMEGAESSQSQRERHRSGDLTRHL